MSMMSKRSVIGTGIVFIALLFIGVTQLCAMEMDIDRRGGQNIRNIMLSNADPAACEKECDNEPACKSWTYVKPGFQGPNARCWIKKDIPGRIRHNCCISGVKGEGPAASGDAGVAGQTRRPYEYGIDRRGGQNIRNIMLSNADPAACEKECDNEPACKSWTYVKPGFQGPNARCWIKKNTPGQMRHDCCISGLK